MSDRTVIITHNRPFSEAEFAEAVRDARYWAEAAEMCELHDSDMEEAMCGGFYD